MTEEPPMALLDPSEEVKGGSGPLPFVPPEKKCTEGKDGFMDVLVEGNCVRTMWQVKNPQRRDWIGIFVHDRKGDSHFSTFQYTNGKENGEIIFLDLVRGYHDIRFFANGSGHHSEGFDIPVFCVGRPVNLTVTRPNRRTLIVSWPLECTASQNMVGLFEASEHSNQFDKNHCIEWKSLSEAETCAPVPRLRLNAPRKPGDYHVRFFYKDSLNAYNNHPTNVYSGLAVVKIEQEDTMEGHFDLDNMKLTVSWHAYSVEPDAKNWIGLYESPEAPYKKWICYEYVNQGKDLRDEGDVTFKADIPALKQWKVNGMPAEVKKWELRFYNSKNVLIFKCPCFP